MLLFTVEQTVELRKKLTTNIPEFLKTSSKKLRQIK